MSEDQTEELIVEKPSRGKRMKRSVFARRRRKEVKQIKAVQKIKLEKEAEKKLKIS